MCWVSNTYYVPFKEKIPDPDVPRGESMIGYYQWVPMILLCQALLFYIPCMVWRFMNNRSGIDVNNIVEAAMTLQHTAYTESKDKTIRYMTKHMDRYLTSQKEYRQGCCVSCKQYMSRHYCLVCGRRYGNYLVFLYIIVKLIYLVNVVSQLFLLDAFLGSDYHMYGAQVLKSLINGEDYGESARFPRITLCDFEVRQLGNIHRHTVQCVLPINLFNEKIYIFIWFWFILVTVATFGSIVTWLMRCLLRLDQIRYVRRHLKSMDKIKKGQEQDKKTCARFVQDYLRQDGVMVLRLVAINSNEIVVAELLASLWEHFKSTKPILNRNRRNQSDDLDLP